jgi:xanthine dehydrogenase accessory factor
MTSSMVAQTNDHVALFATALQWLAQGHTVALATVLKTWGSAPRPSGSHMIVRGDGLFEGSVSGGCVEGAVIADATLCLTEQKSKMLHFGVADAKAWEVGLACGGEISVLVQPVSDAFFSENLMTHIQADTQSGKTVQVNLNTTHGTATLDNKDTDDLFSLVYAPSVRLAIIGAVHISQYLAPMAVHLGYDVTIIDPRGAFAAAERMTGLHVVTEWPDDALMHWKPDPASAIVALTHDPKLDDPALVAALKSSAFYIAALGSRKSHAARCERLKSQGFSETDIKRIHGPAGLSIGAKSPAEIAVSVLAQMTAVRRLGSDHS